MLKTSKVLIGLCVLFLTQFSVSATAQISPDQVSQGREILKEKDIPEDEIRKRLEARGIDPDNIPADKLPQMETILQEIIAEIEAEQSGSSTSPSGFQESTIVSDSGEVEGFVGPKDSLTLETLLSDGSSSELNTPQNLNYAVFGQHIFRNKSIDVYGTAESAFTPDNYVLDKGDQLSITIFGASQADVAYEIEEDGYIRPTNLPKIYLRGVSYGRAKALIKNRFRQAYSYARDEITITVRSSRTITINIFGEIETPGSYTLSALNTAINAIMAAGGVTNSGSVRKIQIIRKGKSRTLDLYDFINNPRQTINLHLENDDIIYIPILEKTARISGAVKRPDNYEVIYKESFQDLLKMAQGFTANADKNLMNLAYLEGNKPRHKDVKMAAILAGKEKLLIKHQDAFYIRSYQRAADDFVIARGPVDYPGQYAFNEDMKISDLIELCMVQDYARTDLAYITRLNSDKTNSLIRVNWTEAFTNPDGPENITLMARDEVTFYRKSTYTGNYRVSIGGAVRNPISHFWSKTKSMTVADLIELAGGLTDAATDFAYLTHTSVKNPKIRSYELLNILDILKNPSNSSINVKLQKGDRIFVFNSYTFTDDYQIEIRGAVRNPLKIAYSSNLGLHDLITMAGGLKAEAASNKIDVYRLEYKNNQATRTLVNTVEIDADYNPLKLGQVMKLKPRDVVVVRLTPEFEPMKFVTLRGEVKYPGDYALLHDEETLADLILRAGGITPEAFARGATLRRQTDITGFIVLNLPKALNNAKSRANLTMKSGDIVNIPKTMDYVTIFMTGTNANRTYTDLLLNDSMVHLTWAGSKSARWYVNHYAGGFSKRAIRRHTQVIHPNGQIMKTRNLLLFKIYPKVKKGSKIALAEREKKVKPVKQKERVSKENIFATLASTLTVVTTALTTAILAKTL
jgi:protein involved in polysaccharide export with SLBB domain